MRKKRLAIVTTHPIQYNAPLFSLLHSNGNIEILVFYTWGEEVLKDKYDPDFGKIINWDIDLLKGYPYRFLQNQSKEKGSHHFAGIDNPDIIKQLKDFAPDAILIYGWPFKSHLKVMRYFKGKIPVLFRGDSTLLDQRKSIKSTLRHFFLKWLYRHVDYALYPGERSYDYFLSAGLRPEQLVQMPHAIDNNRFSPFNNQINEEAMEWRNKMNIPEASMLFLFAGKFEPKKDPIGLLKAFMKVDNLNAHLLMVGNGQLENDLKSMAGEEKRIHFIDFMNQSQMPMLYQMADVFVLPSQGPGESWGLSVNEAMASAKPVMVSDKCGCAASLVVHGKNGYIFKAGDQQALTEALHWMLVNKGKSDEMGANSLSIISEYSFSRQAEAVEQMLTHLKQLSFDK